MLIQRAEPEPVQSLLIGREYDGPPLFIETPNLIDVDPDKGCRPAHWCGEITALHVQILTDQQHRYNRQKA